jgi:ankyrin repeat protein
MTKEIEDLRKRLYFSIEEKSMVTFNHTLQRILSVSSLKCDAFWKIDKQLKSPLLCAIWNDHEMALKLIDSGCTIDFKYAGGVTPLMFAIRLQPRPQVALKLIEIGCDLNCHSDDGWNALLCAVRRGQSNVALKLIKNGCVLNSQNDKGMNALMLTIRQSQTEVALKLIENGCNLNSKNHKGATALRLAIRHDQFEIIPKLIENGCKISGIIQNHKLVTTNMKITEENALLIHHAIRCTGDIYEDFPKELLPFLIRSDLISKCHYQ